MFAAYFDDSGTHDDTGAAEGSEIVVAAGYVGTASEWQALEREWNALLQLKSLPYYHSVDCAYRTGHFKGWSKEECEGIHRSVVEIIVARAIVPIGSAVNTGPYWQRRPRPSDGSKAVPKQGYYQCLWNTLRALGAFMLTVAPEDQVAIVLERSPKTSAPTLSMYHHAVEQPSWHDRRERFAGPPTFRPKEGHPQLQAADVLAYEMGLRLRRQFMPRNSNKKRRSWEALAMHYQRHHQGLELLRFAEYAPPGEPG